MANAKPTPTKKKPTLKVQKGHPIAPKLKMYRGYEIPGNTSKLAKKVLRRLKKNRFVIFEHDDGPSLSVHGELTNIANNIGLEYYTEEHKVVMIDSERVKVVNGSKAKEKSCAPSH